jgi:hypothetical protein
MHSNDTSTTTIPAITTGAGDAAPSRRPRLRTFVGGVIAVGGLTFGIGAALAQESPSSVPAVSDHPAIAEMARANGLTGLSPASLASAAPSTATSSTAADWYADSAAIADWARANGLTGLSPASLAPSDD